MQAGQLGIMLPVAIAGVDAGRVVVAERVAGPAFDRKRFQPGQTLLLVAADMLRGDPLGPHEWEVENEVQFIIPISHIGDVVILADQHPVAIIFVQDGAQFLHQVVQTGPPH